MLRVPINLASAANLVTKSIPAGADESVEIAARALARFLEPVVGSPAHTCVLTGAGVSTDSGIPDYRGPNGTYRQNKTYRPVYYSEFRDRHAWRQRYWTRSYLGYPEVLQARPNTTHWAIANLVNNDFCSHIVTQNVDGLHACGDEHMDEHVTELHGSLHRVVCLSCDHTYPRSHVQDKMQLLNPGIAAASGERMRTNPDGDVEIRNKRVYETFRYPACPNCVAQGVADADQDGAWVRGDGILKPSVVFFGEQVPAHVRKQAEDAIEAAERLLVIGTSLATYSALRLVRMAKSQNKPLAIINWGSQVRDENLLIDESHGDIRIPLRSGDVFAHLQEYL